MWETMATWKIEESDEQKFHKKIRAFENKIPGKSYQDWIQYITMFIIIQSFLEETTLLNIF